MHTRVEITNGMIKKRKTRGGHPHYVYIYHIGIMKYNMRIRPAIDSAAAVSIFYSYFCHHTLALLTLQFFCYFIFYPFYSVLSNESWSPTYNSRIFLNTYTHNINMYAQLDVINRYLYILYIHTYLFIPPPFQCYRLTWYIYIKYIKFSLMYII